MRPPWRAARHPGGSSVTTTRPHILHIGPTPEVPDGGIAAYLLGLLDSPLATEFDLTTLDVTVPRHYRRVRALRPFLSARFVFDLVAKRMRRRPDLVHVHTSDFKGFWEKAMLARLARWGGSPYILHLHGGSFDRFLAGLGGLDRKRAATALEGAARVIVLSESWRPDVQRCAPRAHLEVHPNAIRYGEFEPARRRRSATDSPRLLFLGMIAIRKGLDELLAAVLELRRRHRFTLEIVGDEEFHGEKARFEAQYHRAGVDDIAHFAGAAYGADKLARLRAADIFVLPSHSESFGIANLEAMASGLPVVSTRTGAIPEYIEAGVQGLLVPAEDAGALAQALETLILDAELRQRMGEAGQQRAREFDWPVVAARMAQTYRDILAKRPVPSAPL